VSSNFLRALALRQELDDFPLPPGQGFVRFQSPRAFVLRIATFQIPFENSFSDAGCEEGLALGEGLDGRDQVVTRIGLQQVASRTGAQDSMDHLIGIVNGENQHLCAGCRLEDLACRFQAVEIWHRDVENNDIRLQFTDLLNRFTARNCLATDLPSRLSFEKHSKSAPNDFVIISYENAM
jgi:hypothetical protein